jgi:L-asparaginase / beta-aspartyl-peptidase
MSETWALALHGGAGPVGGKDYSESEAHMRGLLERGRAMLSAGRSAVDVAQEMVRELEACGFHVAGKGASPARNGQWELDAAIMDGPSRNAGAVAALRGFRSPVDAARKVMEESPHVLLVGKGAGAFARKHDLARVWNPKAYYTPAVTKPVKEGELVHGTVGAVALDRSGSLAAATSTGGLLNKTPGRVGDSPIIGAGTWADERVAVSCTGQGEYFLRAAVAADVSARIRYGQLGLKDAAEGALADMRRLGGEGGLIAVDVMGHVALPYNSEGMKRACVTSAGRFEVATLS